MSQHKDNATKLCCRMFFPKVFEVSSSNLYVLSMYGVNQLFTDRGPAATQAQIVLSSVKRKSKVVHSYSAFSISRCSKALYNDQFTLSRPEAYIQSGQCMLVLILPTPEGRKAE